MEIIELSSRHTLFKDALEGWDLYIHLIKAKHYDYLIDTGIGKESMDEVVDYLSKRQKPLRVVNTHYHWDHVMGNDYFCSQMIVGHKLCHKLIQETWEESLAAQKSYSQHSAKQVLPNVLFGKVLEFSDDGLVLFHTPGHTCDGISIYDQVEGVLNLGDNLGDTLEDIIPNIETDESIYRESLKKSLSYAPKLCISCHCGIVEPAIIEKVLAQLEGDAIK